MDEIQSPASPSTPATPLRTPSHREAWLIPGAIVVAGLVLAFATYSIRAKQLALPPQGDVSVVRPVSQDDHIIGNPGAPVVIIEYADIDSSYTKGFQATMEQLMTEYGTSGQVAWVYRHLPLIDQHPASRSHAEAAECIASLGGPNVFWRFIDALNAQAPSDAQFDPSGYDPIVESLGVRAEAFDSCMTAGTFSKRVENDFENGLDAGAGGSPFSVVLIKGHAPITIDGAVPYDGMKKIITDSIKEAGA